MADPATPDARPARAFGPRPPRGAHTEISTTAARFTASATEDLEAPELTVSLTSVFDGPLTTLTLRYVNGTNGTYRRFHGIGISSMCFTAEDCPT